MIDCKQQEKQNEGDVHVQMPFWKQIKAFINK